MSKISIRARLTIFGACVAAIAGLVASMAGVAAASSTCTPTGFYRDGINLTAAMIGGNVTGNLDATGCDIGVYYGPGAAGTVFGAKIANARYFGVVNDGGNVNVARSTISKIGNTPFDGAQHGVGIFYTTEHVAGSSSGTARGMISGNTLPSYQKGGITVRGTGASATIEGNKVTGSGQVDYIAQNGIQVSFGATATVMAQHRLRQLVHADDERGLRPALLQGGRGQAAAEPPVRERDRISASSDSSARQRCTGRPAPAGLLAILPAAAQHRRADRSFTDRHAHARLTQLGPSGRGEGTPCCLGSGDHR